MIKQRVYPVVIKMKSKDVQIGSVLVEFDDCGYNSRRVNVILKKKYSFTKV